MSAQPEPLQFDISPETRVSALWLRPDHALACYVMAHGAGAGMKHAFMADVAAKLAERGIATLRYQFPYLERQSRRPDSEAVCHATVRAAVATTQVLAAGLPLFAGGKSFGGRMTSQAQAITPLPGVRGLVFLGFPLHPAGKPSSQRAEHLQRIRIPMLFLQGTRDALAELSLLQPLIGGLGVLASLRLFAGADHSYHVQRSTGTTDDKVRAALADDLAAWARAAARVS
jgi:predicted alpha/beta-hydrolase family hydrolase